MKSWKSFFDSPFDQHEPSPLFQHPRVSVSQPVQRKPTGKPPADQRGGELQVWPPDRLIARLYEIQAVRGYGGMGLVYRAYDHTTHQDMPVQMPLSCWDSYQADRVCCGNGLTLAEGLDVAVCWATEYVYRQGLVHPDLKTANVLLRRNSSGRLVKALGVGGLETAELAGDVEEVALWAMISDRGKAYCGLFVVDFVG